VKRELARGNLEKVVNRVRLAGPEALQIRLLVDMTTPSSSVAMPMAGQSLPAARRQWRGHIPEVLPALKATSPG
jgi:hypothetical protein